jgi:hypothetical protein
MPSSYQISSFIPGGPIVESETLLNAEIVLALRAAAASRGSARLVSEWAMRKDAILSNAATWSRLSRTGWEPKRLPKG